MEAPKCRLCGKAHWGLCGGSRNEVARPLPALQPAHRVWLESHASRSREWLAARIAEGFEVHHVDRDHGNNDPDNLVLVDGEDHAKLHRLIREVDPTHSKFDRTAYQRELMRKRRAAAKAASGEAG